jgi:hypothetical protein
VFAHAAESWHPIADRHQWATHRGLQARHGRQGAVESLTLDGDHRALACWVDDDVIHELWAEHALDLRRGFSLAVAGERANAMRDAVDAIIRRYGGRS